MPINEPTESGGYNGDLFYGDPENTTKATHRWCGIGSSAQWVPLDDKGDPIYALEAKDATPVEPIMQFFAWQHLPSHLRPISKPFGDLAVELVENLPRNPERKVALRKLLEAKDAAVRAAIFKES
jgi:hypothetical protein